VTDGLGDRPLAVLEEPVEPAPGDEVRRRDRLWVERRVAEALVDVAAHEGAQRIGRARQHRGSWEMLDDWGDPLGLKGSASHSVRFDGDFVDELFCRHELVMVDLDVDEPTPGYLLHGNPMYAGRSLGLFMCELTAVVVGAGRAVLDEYERIITSRQTTWGPKMLRYQHADYQRHLGMGMAQILMAETAVLHMAHEWTELCRRGMEDGVPYSMLHLGFPKDQLPATGA
jgi:hypothetical protein